MPSKKCRAFISYARADGEQFATDLRRRLEKAGVAACQDRSVLRGGIDWWMQVKKAIEESEFLVLVMTPGAMRSTVTRDEWLYARKQGVCVCPVMGVSPDKLDFASLPRWMAKAHCYNLEHEWESFIGELRSPCSIERVPHMAPELPYKFVERPREFERLLELLLDKDRENPVAITTALKGAGGFGKTSLAVALCHDDGVLDAYSDGILWVTLGEKPDIKGALTKLYAGLTGERPDFVDAEDAGNGLAEKLERKDCLVVLDDVWNPSHLQPFEKALRGCGCLITTRIAEVAQRAVQVDVDQMSSDEAVEMLIRKLDPRPEDDRPFRSLAARMGEWPLLLELASAALQEQTRLGESTDGSVAYLNRAMDELGIHAFDRDNPQQRHDAVSLTVAVSLKFLLEEEIERFRQLAVFPEDVEVPLEVVGELWGITDVQTRRLAQRLANLSLLDRLDYQSKTLRLHDVMRDYLVFQSEPHRLTLCFGSCPLGDFTKTGLDSPPCFFLKSRCEPSNIGLLRS